MLEGALILVLTVVLVLVVAAGVVAVLALSRRSADEWKGVIKREGEEIAVEVKTSHSLPKRPRRRKGPSFRVLRPCSRCSRAPSPRAPTSTLTVSPASIASKLSPTASASVLTVDVVMLIVAHSRVRSRRRPNFVMPHSGFL